MLPVFSLRLAALLALLLPLPIAGHANDAVAGLDTGELVMRKSDAIEMAEEDLYLSLDQPGALVSLCRDGIRKTGLTTFEWQAQNWRLGRNLSVLFLAPPQ